MAMNPIFGAALDLMSDDRFTSQFGLFNNTEEDELTKKKRQYLENKRNAYFKSMFDEEYEQSKDVFESQWQQEYNSSFNDDPFSGNIF